MLHMNDMTKYVNVYSSESDSDQDIVLEEFGSESDPESETEDEPENECSITSGKRR